MPRFAANLAYLFTEHAPLERFAAAAAAGFTAVELQFPYDQSPAAMKAELAKHGLAMLGLNTERGDADKGEFGVAALPGREREFDAIFAQALDTVTAIGGCQIHVLAGHVPSAQRPAAERTFVENLRRAADAAQAKGVTLLIEPINPRDRPDYFLNTPEHAADIIAQVGRSNVKIQFDFYHVQIVGGDLITRYERHRPLVGHIQIASVPARHEPDEGEIAYPAIFDAVDRLGWDGHVACEYRPRGRTGDGLGWARPYGVVPRSGA